MNNKLLSIGLISLMIACKSGDESDKKAKLESLKKQMVEIKGQITTLEAEIAASDTTMSINEKAKTIAATTLSYQTFNNYIEVQGRVDGDDNVSISPEAGGNVSKINVSIGDEVSKGQVLIELDNKVLQQGIAELQNALELANNLYQKQKNLWDQKIGTEVQFLTAKNQKDGLERKMATLQQQLDMTRIKAPISGTVDAIDTKVGQLAVPGYPIARVVNFDRLKVKAEVAESYSSKVKRGNDAIVIFPDVMDTLTTKISHSAKVISPLNRTFSVEVALNNQKQYSPNMVAIVKIINYSNPKAIIVPVNTIQKTEMGDYVMIAENNKAKKAHVKVGAIYNGKAEILNGLKEGDKLIVKGFQDLDEGQEIKF